MKTSLKYLFALSSFVLMTSCSLKEDRTLVPDPDNFFRTYQECQYVLNSCYMPMNDMYNATFFVVTECVSDNMSGNGNFKDAYLDFSPASPEYGNNAWKSGYKGVSRCNYAVWGLENMPEGVVSEEQKIQLLCEAKAMRGFYYLYLTSMFGDVPFYFNPILTMEDQDKVGQLGRMSAAATRDSVIVDLLNIAPLASQTRTSDNPQARSGAALAYMIIAKCAMWNASEHPEYWDTALTAIEALEAIYGDFSQYDYVQNVLFRNKNTPESILEVQHEYKQGGVQYYSNLASRCIPTPVVLVDKEKQIYTFAGVEIPELGTHARDISTFRPNQSFVKTQNRDSGDIRAEVNMAWGYGGKDFNNVSKTPHLGPKFWCPNIQQTSDGNNYKVYRYADAILMKAECLCEKKDYQNALKYLNKTRLRAQLPEFTDERPEKIIEEIRAERAKELFGEFQRKFDLVRWGIFHETVKAKNDYKTIKEGLLPCHRYYPIPDSEVAKCKNLNNDEYEEYGF